jgi:hypothetical protein
MKKEYYDELYLQLVYMKQEIQISCWGNPMGSLQVQDWEGNRSVTWWTVTNKLIGMLSNLWLTFFGIVLLYC